MSKSRITMKDLYAQLDSLGPNEIILDGRSPEEYRAGHVPRSKNIPYDKIAAHAADLKKYECIYIHCQAGKRASVATETLVKLGFTNIVCVAGSGMGDWIASGYPVER